MAQLDPEEKEIGYAEEQGASVLRRLFPWLTSKHAIFANGGQVASVATWTFWVAPPHAPSTRLARTSNDNRAYFFMASSLFFRKPLGPRVAGFTAALTEGWHIRRLMLNWQL